MGNITLKIKSNILIELSAKPNNEDDRGYLKTKDPKIKHALI
jgi:GTP cyclohydrolase II